MSPWHDIEMESKCDEEYTLTGVIEITQNTTKKLECMKELPHNPIMQDYKKNEDGKYIHRSYVKAPQFNYGFIPQTWCDDSCGGDADAIDLVDLSWKELKPILAVSDYLVLGMIGLVDQGELDYKVLAIEINEARHRNITSLDTYKRQNPGHIEQIQEWFRDYKTWEGKQQNKFLWSGEILN